MMLQFVARLAVVLALMGPLQSLAAETADECKARCHGLAEADLRACSELPANPSCGKAVEAHREQCYEFCGRQYPERSDPPPQEDQARPSKCDSGLKACP
jgi:hypothetical protein